MFKIVELEGVLAICFSLAIPIVAIVMMFVNEMKKKKRDTEVRLALIQQGIDAETAKIILGEQKKPNKKYSSLHAGCVLLGLGLGGAISILTGMDAHNHQFWVPLVGGMGLGFLVSFVIEHHLRSKEKREEAAQE